MPTMRQSRQALEQGKPHNSSRCEICRNKLAFAVPDHLLNQLREGNVVLFAGAGASTEARTVFTSTFYEEVRAALGLSKSDCLPFPDLMQRFCEQADGRKALLQRIHKRFAYVSSFQELYRTA